MECSAHPEPICRLPQLVRLLFCFRYHAHHYKSEGTKMAVPLHKLSTHFRLRRRQPQLLCLFQKCLLQCLPSLGVTACKDHCMNTERTDGSSPCVSGRPCTSNSTCSMAACSGKEVHYPNCPIQQLSPQSVMHEQSTSQLPFCTCYIHFAMSGVPLAPRLTSAAAVSMPIPLQRVEGSSSSRSTIQQNYR